MRGVVPRVEWEGAHLRGGWERVEKMESIMERQAREWVRVTKREPCKVCAREDYCTRSADGAVAKCMRIKSDRPVESGGWIHTLGEALPIIAPVRIQKPRPTDTMLHNRWAPRMRAAWRNHGAEVALLAEALGVAPWTLDALKVGWSVGAWWLPERNHRQEIIGINRRLADGRKLCIPGSRRGLTYADEWADYPGAVWIVEGASDVAAGLTMGLCVVGRPNNIGAKYLPELLGPLTGRKIVVMGENDRKPDKRWPGQEGAVRVATLLAKRLGRSIVVKYPPSDMKDLRHWFNAIVPTLTEDHYGDVGLTWCKLLGV